MKEEPICSSSGIRTRIARLPICGKALNRVLEVPNAFFHPTNSPANLTLAKLLSKTCDGGNRIRVLNIGSRSPHKTDTINLDLIQNGNADVIADATYMPFRSNSFDLIINVAVMEHTMLPHVIAAECHRVLRPGGKLYCAVPFFQMYHPDPIDMQRYTITGLRNLFSELSPIESGVELGPASAVSLTLREFFAILCSANSNLLYNLFQVLFGYLFYPLKFLDYFLVRSKFAFMIACSVYFVGQKR